MSRRLGLILVYAACAAMAFAGNVLDRCTDLTQAEFKTGTNGVRYLEIAEARHSMAKTELMPVSPGKKYRLTLHRYGPGVSDIDIFVLLYDEDLHLLHEGCYPPEWDIRGFRFYAAWDAGLKRWREMTMPEEAAFVQIVVASDKIARLDALVWDEIGGTELPVKPLPASPYVVVVPTRPSEPLAFAAAELRHWIWRITGKRVSLVHAGSVAEVEGTNSLICLGHDFLPVDTGKNDSWRITRKDGVIFLTARMDEGVCNAVYDLLERNTDIIFARNERIPGGVVFTEKPDLVFTNCDSHVVPKFASREFGFVGEHFNPPTQIWCRRNYLNHRGGFYGKWHILSTSMVVFRDHLRYELGSMIPNDKYFETHPEFFGMREGIRRAYEHYGTQPCYTCEAGRREIAGNLIACLRRDMVPRITGVNLAYGDTWDLCCCSECIRDVTLPSGRVLPRDDPEFRSYQFFRFVLGIAEEIHREFPGLEVNTLGYIYASIPPPELSFPPYFSITFCPYPKCCSVTVYDDTKNSKWHERSEMWGKSGALMNIYEYYGNAISWPRPACDIAAKDMIYWNALGFGNLMYCEMPPDNRQRAEGNAGMGFAGAWDLSAMENWVMARLFVDPARDVAALRREYCRRAYRGAAEEMLAFYARIHQEWRKAGYKGWAEDGVQSMNTDIRPAGLEKPLREMLVRAQAKADHPASQLLVGHALTQWDRQIAAAEKAVPPTQEIPHAGIAAGTLPDFEDAVWEGACTVTNFSYRWPQEVIAAPWHTEARAIHDNHYLHVRFRCEGVTDTVQGGPADGGRLLDGDSVAVFVSPRKGANEYTVYRAYPDGGSYDARAYDGTWTADGFTVKAACAGEGWQAVLRIPLAAAGVNPTVPGDTFFNFVRSTGRGDAWRSYTSTGADAHDTNKYNPYAIEAQ